MGGHGAHEDLRPGTLAGSDVAHALLRLGRLGCVATSREGHDLIGAACRLLSLLLLEAKASLVDRHDGRLACLRQSSHEALWEGHRASGGGPEGLAVEEVFAGIGPKRALDGTNSLSQCGVARGHFGCIYGSRGVTRIPLSGIVTSREGRRDGRHPAKIFCPRGS